jgi:hypothetical protein
MISVCHGFTAFYIDLETDTVDSVTYTNLMRDALDHVAGR